MNGELEIEKMDQKEFRVLIKHCFFAGKNAIEAKAWLDKHYLDFAPEKSTVEKWFDKFKQGEMSTEDEAREGSPNVNVTIENINNVQKIISDNRKVKLIEIAETLNMSKERVGHIVSEYLNMRKPYSKWVSRKLTIDQKLPVAINRKEIIDKMVLDQLKETTSRKRKPAADDEDTATISPPSKTPKKAAAKKEKSKIPDVTALDFDNECKSADGKPWNLKLASWNVNGIRAWLEKNGVSYVHHEKPDILCLQETKCSDDNLPSEANIEGYHCYWLAGDEDGYSGVGLLSKEKPISVQYGIDVVKHDIEGRVITAEYKNFYLVATYVPNAGRGLVRLDYRQEWDEHFRAYLKKLDEKKPVVLCGDLNVAHEEIDLANPKTNKKNAGFTKEEREGFSTLLSEGFVDTFRHLYPDSKGAYTFWTYMMNARAKNVGWRLDYFIVSKRFVESVCDSVIRKDVYGSDHCPITLFLHV